MKRRTEIDIELTRTLLIRRPAAPCECPAGAAEGGTVAPGETAFTADAGTCMIYRSVEAERVLSVENPEACEAIEIESAEGQLILAAAVRSLEQRLSAEARALLCSGQNAPAPNGANRNGFYLKLQSFYRFIRPRASRSAGKGK